MTHISAKHSANQLGKKFRTHLHIAGLLMLSLFAASCASVPPESVELSYLVGKDLRELKKSYDLLIQQRFADHRARRHDYLEKEWNPAFIAVWIEDGMLVETAKGQVVYDEASDEFVAPTPGREQQQLLSTIYDWSNAAVETIEEKRKELIDPIDRDEARIRAEAAAAFDQIIQANAIVTAHLSSIRDVKALQDSALESFGAKDLVGDLNNRLIELSALAEDGLDKIRQGDEIIDRANEIRDQIFDSD